MKKTSLKELQKESQLRDIEKVNNNTHHWVIDEKLRCRKLVRICT